MKTPSKKEGAPIPPEDEDLYTRWMLVPGLVFALLVAVALIWGRHTPASERAEANPALKSSIGASNWITTR